MFGTYYTGALKEMEEAGFVEEVENAEWSDPDGSVHYLPHHPVVKETSSTTKVRPVFDAAAKGPSQVNLNDCLNSGPSLNPSLTDVLRRFGRGNGNLVLQLTS